MADYTYVTIGDITYSVPAKPRKRAKQPPILIVMNDSCTCCSGSPACMPECPVDCIHVMYRGGRPYRVYVDNAVCIGCMNCLSDTLRPKHVIKGDVRANSERINAMDLASKDGVCPWNAIEVHPYEAGEARSREFYEQPRRVAEREAEAEASS